MTIGYKDIIEDEQECYRKMHSAMIKIYSSSIMRNIPHQYIADDGKELIFSERLHLITDSVRYCVITNINILLNKLDIIEEENANTEEFPTYNGYEFIKLPDGFYIDCLSNNKHKF